MPKRKIIKQKGPTPEQIFWTCVAILAVGGYLILRGYTDYLAWSMITGR